jgi:hypothetical protein
MHNNDKIKKFMMATKPEWCKAVDVVMMVYFLLVCDEYGNCHPSQPEMAKSIGGPTVNLEGMRKGLDRMATHGWILRDKRKVGHVGRNLYQVQFNSLPGLEVKHVETPTTQEPVL